MNIKIIFFFCAFLQLGFSKVKVGVDVFFEDGCFKLLKDKKIGLITNHTGMDSNFKSTIDRFKAQKFFLLKALFSPEHGIGGAYYAADKINGSRHENIVIHSLYGETKKPTKNMLKDIDVLIYDIQDIGSRSYTYLTTLLYVMEEAAKYKKEVIVLDRPNPIGDIVDGPMLDEKYRSFVGYINIPYCHGMTIGELSSFFNKEYKIGCSLKVIKMKGYKRSMSFKDTGLFWIPTSPHIPEQDTPFFYPSTGILGELSLVNIGVGYTLPFKIVGAPWINAKIFASKLNEQKLKGVKFIPFYFKPFYGLYKNKTCNGIKIIITDYKKYKPVSVQYIMLGILKSLYPKEFYKRMIESKSRKEMFFKVNGTSKIYDILMKEKFPAWKLIEFQKKQNKGFLEKRKQYLFLEYAD